jgi:hypothetical protein
MGLPHEKIADVPVKKGMGNWSIGPLKEPYATGASLASWTGDLKSAADVAGSGLVKGGDYPVLLRFLALGYVDAGDDSSAQGVLETLRAERHTRITRGLGARDQSGPPRPEARIPDGTTTTTVNTDTVVNAAASMARAYALLKKNAQAAAAAEIAERASKDKLNAASPASALQMVAEAWAALGNIERANAAAEQIMGEPNRSNALSAVAVALARSGKPDQAFTMIPRISVELRATALDAVATARARAAMLKAAREAAGLQSDDSRKLETYAHVLSAWIARGDKKWAEYDANSDFMNAWQDVWWDEKRVPRIPGNKRVTTW